VRGRGDGVGKGGKGKDGRGGKGRTGEGREGEYHHFFLYTLSTAENTVLSFTRSATHWQRQSKYFQPVDGR